MTAVSSTRTQPGVDTLSIGALALVGVLLIVGALSLQQYWLLVVLVAAALAAPAIAPVVTSGHILGLIVVSTVVAPRIGGAEYLSLGLCLLAFGIWAIERLTNGVLQAHPDGTVTAISAFMAVAVLSFVIGQYPWFPTNHAPMRAQLGGLALFVASGSLVLLTGHLVRSLGQLKSLTWVFVTAGGLFVVREWIARDALAVVDALTQPDTVGSLFWTWFVAITLSQAFFNTELTGIARGGLLLLGGLAIGRGLFLAFSWTSGWLPPLVAASLLAAFRCPRLTLGLAALAVAPAMVLLGPAIEAFLSGESFSWMTRVEAARVMVQVLERNPWLGYGPANYYHYTTLFPIMGWWVRFNSHNNYLDIVAQTGLIGLATFLWFALQTAFLARRIRQTATEPFARAYGTGVLAGLMATLVAALLADWVVPFAYNIGIKGFRSSLLFWFFAGGLLAIARLQAARPAIARVELTTSGVSRQHTAALRQFVR